MKHSILVQKTAHYHVIKSSGKTESILLAIHGYAELAEQFIAQFKPLTNHGIMVIAPEGLSTFYGKDKKPAASWMTSHERESEIKDYINYLNQLIDSIKLKYPDTELNALGFSQGVSTLIRWMMQAQHTISNAHLIAGSIPPEIEKVNIQRMKSTNYKYFYGSQDRLLNLTQAKLQYSILESLDLNVELINFDGRHEVPQLALDFIANK